jgi:glutaconate CoA-transferase subunit A
MDKRERKNKVLTLSEAARLIQDGDIVYTSGILGRKPFALEYEMIRQGKKDLILLNVLIYGEDLMIGAGCVRGYYGCYVGMGPFGLCQNFGRAVKENDIAVVEGGHLEMVYGLAAGAMGIPFIPSKASLGTDILNPNYVDFDKLKGIARHPEKFPVKGKIQMDDPFGSGQQALTAAIRPDVAIIHAQYAGPDGTVRITGPLGSDLDAVRAADIVIVTCEQILPESYLRREPHFNTFGSTEVDYVVEAPWGSHPGSVYEFYDVDPGFLRAYQKMSRSEEGTKQWLDEWVYGVKDHQAYIEKLGVRKLDALKVKDPVLGYKPWDEWERDLL